MKKHSEKLCVSLDMLRGRTSSLSGDLPKESSIGYLSPLTEHHGQGKK